MGMKTMNPERAKVKLTTQIATAFLQTLQHEERGSQA